jgi:hypothetical protein
VEDELFDVKRTAGDHFFGNSVVAWAAFLLQLLISESNSGWSMTINVASFGCWNVGRLGRWMRVPKVVENDLANLSAIAAFVVIGEPSA